MNTHKCLSDADLNQLSEGNVTVQNREIFQKHIESCSDCSARWQQVVQGHTILESMLNDARSGRGKCPSKETLDSFAEALEKIHNEAHEDPELLHSAPHITPVYRLDEATAARKPVLCYKG